MARATGLNGVWERMRSWSGGLSTLGLVTVITALAWLVAEAQTLQTERVVLAVRFDTSIAETAVRVSPGSSWGGVVEVEVEGPASLLTQLRESARESLVLSVGEEVRLPAAVGVGAAGGASELGDAGAVLGAGQVVDLAEALGRHEVFRRGLTVLRTDPPTTSLEVRPTVAVSIPVSVDTGGVVTRGPAVPDPESVGVTAPDSVARLLPPVAVARLSPADAGGLEPGVEAVVTGVPVALDWGPAAADVAWGVRLSRERVTVRLTPRQRTLALVLSDVPVRLLVDPAVSAGWLVSLVPDGAGEAAGAEAVGAEADAGASVGGAAPGRDPAVWPTAQVRVAGPVAVVEQMKAGDRTPLAFVRVRAADVEAALLGAGAGEGAAGLRLRLLPEVTGLPAGVAAEVVSESVEVVLLPAAMGGAAAGPTPGGGEMGGALDEESGRAGEAAGEEPGSGDGAASGS